ncbi:MAG: hypothetical protein D6705_14480 [Deltaproteobacteria bacterium]|nr:MAG: hypothetical protein D6705_14480 [Deltaproteobacteria bacterium]
MARVRHRFATAVAAAVVVTLAAPMPAEADDGKRRKRSRRFKDETDPATGYVDPRARKLPRTHRFRLGLEAFYMRLTRARGNDGSTQQFHLAPLGIDAAYQAQFLKYMMARLSLAFAINAANTFAAMPYHIHPKLHLGYQGKLVGVAIGYGYFTPLYYLIDQVDPVRGGLPEPVVRNNHHIDGELSFTTRDYHGALSFIFRVSAVHSTLDHLNRRAEKGWRPMFTLNVGWFFGETERGRKRRLAREAAREQRKKARQKRRRRR